MIKVRVIFFWLMVEEEKTLKDWSITSPMELHIINIKEINHRIFLRLKILKWAVWHLWSWKLYWHKWQICHIMMETFMKYMLKKNKKCQYRLAVPFPLNFCRFPLYFSCEILKNYSSSSTILYGWLGEPCCHVPQSNNL